MHLNVYEVVVELAAEIDEPFTPEMSVTLFASDEHRARERVDDWVAEHNLVIVSPPEVELVSDDPAAYLNGQEA